MLRPTRNPHLVQQLLSALRVNIVRDGNVEAMERPNGGRRESEEVGEGGEEEEEACGELHGSTTEENGEVGWRGEVLFGRGIWGGRVKEGGELGEVGRREGEVLEVWWVAVELLAVTHEGGGSMEEERRVGRR